MLGLAVAVLLSCSKYARSEESRRIQPVTPILTSYNSSTSSSTSPSTLSSMDSRLHRCQDSGEAYSASWLATREHVVYQFTGFNLTWVNCEMASFIMMDSKQHERRQINGTLTMSLDVLDLSVIHLSAYERLQRRHKKKLTQTILKEFNKNNTAGTLDAIHTAAHLAQKDANLSSNSIHWNDPRMNSTVVVMPFLASGMGAGHSVVSNRRHYLQACFWSFYAFYKHIVVFVKSEDDANYVRKYCSDLPFHDIIVLHNLPKMAALPVASVKATKALLSNDSWSFQYVFFTESDQILVMRDPALFYDHLTNNPRKLVVPHRIMPYPDILLSAIYKKTPDPSVPSIASCCLKRQNCPKDRRDWVHVSDPSVRIVTIFGLHVALGNTNFHAETYRPCALTAERLKECP